MQVNDAQTLVLCALAEQPLHGYAINTAIAELTGERLGPGSLYGALARLEAKGYIESIDGSGRQRPVRITEAGRQYLEQSLQAMAKVAATGLRNLRLSPGSAG